MDNFLLTHLNNFSFSEILCIYLLWRVEHKLDAFTASINQLLFKFESQIEQLNYRVGGKGGDHFERN